MSLENAVRTVSDCRSLVALLADDLNWDIDPEAAQDDVTFEWSGNGLNLRAIKSSPALRWSEEDGGDSQELLLARGGRTPRIVVIAPSNPRKLHQSKRDLI